MWLPKNSSGVKWPRSGALERPIVAFLSQLLLVMRSRFKPRARLEAENIPEEARRHDTAVGGYARVFHEAFVDSECPFTAQFRRQLSTQMGLCFVEVLNKVHARLRSQV